jgi:hypothetical protein
MLLYSIRDLFVSSVIYTKMNKDKLKLFQHYFQVLLMVCFNILHLPLSLSTFEGCERVNQSQVFSTH